MKVSCSEGVATHTGPESCAGARKDGGEALTGERAGRVLSREIQEKLWDADAVQTGGRRHGGRRQRETPSDPARSETPCTYGSTLLGNREIPCSSALEGVADRIAKSKDVRR